MPGTFYDPNRKSLYKSFLYCAFSCSYVDRRGTERGKGVIFSVKIQPAEQADLLTTDLLAKDTTTLSLLFIVDDEFYCKA